MKLLLKDEKHSKQETAISLYGQSKNMNSFVLGINQQVSKLEQPLLEFLATDKFGIIQTGKRELIGLKVSFRGNPQPKLKSNEVFRPLFGQALKTQSPGFVYIDAEGNGLQFTGSTYKMESFTVGFYVHVSKEKTDNIIWSEVVIHGFYFPYGDYDNYLFRLMPHAEGTAVSLVYNGVGTWGNVLKVSIPEQQQKNWLHVTFTYNSNTRIVKGYLDGIFQQGASVPNWQANGEEGAYVYLYLRCPISIA